MLTPFHPRRAYRLLLIVHVTGAAAMGVALIGLPARYVSGPVTAVVYQHIDRHIWGVAFLIAAGWLAGATFYDELWFGIPLMLGVQATFAAGITWAIAARGSGSLLGPIAFLMLAGTIATATLYQRR